MMARSLTQQVDWLWDDLKKQLGEEVMSKWPEMVENIGSEDNRGSPQKLDEATLQKQKILESELLTLPASRYTSWAQLCEKIIEMKARHKEEEEDFVQSTAPKSESKAEETTSDRRQREELKQHAADHREPHDSYPTKLSSDNLDNDVTLMPNDGANLGKSTADSMVKNATQAQMVERQRTVKEQQKILEDEIALLKKKKARQKLEREVAENEVTAVEALCQEKQSEQWQKKWDDEREAKTDKQFWDGWDNINWDVVFGIAQSLLLAFQYAA